MRYALLALSIVAFGMALDSYLATPPGSCWVCFGPCASDANCGSNCVCVGSSTGVGQCVSR